MWIKCGKGEEFFKIYKFIVVLDKKNDDLMKNGMKAKKMKELWRKWMGNGKWW